MIKRKAHCLSPDAYYMYNGFSGKIWNAMDDHINPHIEEKVNFTLEWNKFRNYWLYIIPKYTILMQDYSGDINYDN